MKLFIFLLVAFSSAFADYQFNFLKEGDGRMYATLKQNDKPVLIQDLKTVHENKFHAFIVSQDLEVYHHVHPHDEGEGVLSFDVSNLDKSKNYRVWGEFTTVENEKHHYVFFDIMNVDIQHIIPVYNLTKQYEGIDFTLSFSEQPTDKTSLNAKITITKNGQPFNDLQDVMGEKAHLVGFSNNNHNIAHIHPISFEEGELLFHIEFSEKGFAKLFAQFKIDGKEVVIPFGIDVL